MISFFHRYFRGFAPALIFGALCLSSPAKADGGPLVDIPELTSAIDKDHQVILKVSLRMAGPKSEELARQHLPRLRHALVLMLADRGVKDFNAAGLEDLTEIYRGEANKVLGRKAAVKSVLLQSFVIQDK